MSSIIVIQWCKRPLSIRSFHEAKMLWFVQEEGLVDKITWRDEEINPFEHSMYLEKYFENSMEAKAFTEGMDLVLRLQDLNNLRGIMERMSTQVRSSSSKNSRSSSFPLICEDLSEQTSGQNESLCYYFDSDNVTETDIKYFIRQNIRNLDYLSINWDLFLEPTRIELEKFQSLPGIKVVIERFPAALGPKWQDFLNSEDCLLVCLQEQLENINKLAKQIKKEKQSIHIIHCNYLPQFYEISHFFKSLDLFSCAIWSKCFFYLPSEI